LIILLHFNILRVIYCYNVEYCCDDFLYNYCYFLSLSCVILLIRLYKKHFVYYSIDNQCYESCVSPLNID